MPKLMVIPQDLSRAVLNVVNNAAYSVKERTLQEEEKKNADYKPEIKVSAKYEDGNLTIKITDNGTGIPEDVQKKLFHENITTKPVGQGTGLGMQITHDIIVNAHKGEITVDSEVGKGATVTFVIPAKSLK
jgi:signal transduction histidine kinase